MLGFYLQLLAKWFYLPLVAELWYAVGTLLNLSDERAGKGGEGGGIGVSTPKGMRACAGVSQALPEYLRPSDFL